MIKIVFLLILSVTMGTAKNVLSKTCPPQKIYRFNSIVFFIAFLFSFTFIGLGISGSGLNFAPYILLMALIYTVLMLVAHIAYIKAVSIGDFAISSFMYSCGFVIPAIVGALIYHENITVSQIIGLIVLIASFVVGSLRRTGGKTGNLWLFLSISAMLASGAIGLLQKVYSHSIYKADLDSLLTPAFLLMSVVSAILAFTKVEPTTALATTANENYKENLLVLFAFLLGVVVLAQNKTNLFLSGALDSMITFPVINGGTVVVSALCDFFILKKKPDLRKIISIFMGIIAIILIAIKV